MAFETFFKYKKQIEEDLKFDQELLKETAIKLPVLKHFWVAKLVEAKISLNKLEKTKAEAIKAVRDKVKASVGLSQSSYNKIIGEQEPIKNIDENIEELKLIIDYLEKVEKIFSQASFDFKNLVDVMKMEQMI